jgi:hypothetical protein
LSLAIAARSSDLPGVTTAQIAEDAERRRKSTRLISDHERAYLEHGYALSFAHVDDDERSLLLQ